VELAYALPRIRPYSFVIECRVPWFFSGFGVSFLSPPHRFFHPPPMHVHAAYTPAARLAVPCLLRNGCDFLTLLFFSPLPPWHFAGAGFGATGMSGERASCVWCRPQPISVPLSVRTTGVPTVSSRFPFLSLSPPSPSSPDLNCRRLFTSLPLLDDVFKWECRFFPQTRALYTRKSSPPG